MIWLFHMFFLQVTANLFGFILKPFKSPYWIIFFSPKSRTEVLLSAQRVLSELARFGEETSIWLILVKKQLLKKQESLGG